MYSQQHPHTFYVSPEIFDIYQKLAKSGCIHGCSINFNYTVYNNTSKGGRFYYDTTTDDDDGTEYSEDIPQKKTLMDETKPKISKKEWEDRLDCHLFFNKLKKVATIEGEYDEFKITKAPKCETSKTFCRCMKCFVHRKKLLNVENYRQKYLELCRKDKA